MLLRSLWRIWILNRVSLLVVCKFGKHTISNICIFSSVESVPLRRRSSFCCCGFLLTCFRINFLEEELDEEEVYKMAAIMSSSGGLEAMLSRYYNSLLFVPHAPTHPAYALMERF